MKAVIDTDVLTDFINNTNTNLFSQADFRERAQSNNLSFWVAALSIYQVPSTCDYDKVKDCLNFVSENFSTIPIVLFYLSANANNFFSLPGPEACPV